MEGDKMPFRERKERSASPKKDMRSVSPRSVKPICAETPSSSSASHNAHAVMPKDFRVPLTCFFWYHTGVCKKSDSKCLYAHYHTGTVAEPPISYNGKIMGGNRAKKMIGNIGQREEELDLRSAEVYDSEQRLAVAQADLKERTNAVIAREEHMQQREQGLLECRNALSSQDQTNHEREQALAVFEEGMLRQLEDNYNSIASTVGQMRRAVGNAQRILANRRQQVLYHENLPSAMQDTHGQGRYGGSIAIDGAIGALGGLDAMLAESENTLLAQIHNAIRPQNPY